MKGLASLVPILPAVTLAAAELSVDFTQSCGELKRLNGVVNSIKLTQHANPRIRAEYAALEPPYVRFHDAALANPGAAVTDVSRIFPLFHLDENDPRNYDFRPTDDLLALTRGFCTEIEFKIGESIKHYEPANWTPASGRDSEEVYRELTGVDGGAFTASMLLLGQDSAYDRMFYYQASGDGGFWGLRGGSGDGTVNSHWYALKAFADLARLRQRVKTFVPLERGFAAAATRAEDGRAALMVAAFRPVGSEPVRVSVKGTGRPTEVLLEDGEAHRLSACDGWTFADGMLTLPNAGRSAVRLVTFGGYRVPRLPHLEGGKIAPKTDWTRSDLVDEDGRLAFAFVVPREMIVRGSPLIERIRALTRKTFGAVPEVYGDDDNEKTSQAPALIALGQTAPIRHAKLLSFRQPGDGAYDRLAAFFLQLR